MAAETIDWEREAGRRKEECDRVNQELAALKASRNEAAAKAQEALSDALMKHADEKQALSIEITRVKQERGQALQTLDEHKRALAKVLVAAAAASRALALVYEQAANLGDLENK